MTGGCGGLERGSLSVESHCADALMHELVAGRMAALLLSWSWMPLVMC